MNSSKKVLFSGSMKNNGLKYMLDFLRKLRSKISKCNEDLRNLKASVQLVQKTSSINRVVIGRQALINLLDQINLLKANFTSLSGCLLADLGPGSKAAETQKELSKAHNELKNLRQEILTLKDEMRNFRTFNHRAKLEQFNLQSELEELHFINFEQSSYLTKVGAVTCSLLWRVSQSEDSVKAIISASEFGEFLLIVKSVLEGYLEILEADQQEAHKEHLQHTCAVVGIFSNFAARSCGREYLVNHEIARHVLQIMSSSTNILRNHPNSRLLNIILMALYNMSINRKGLELLLADEHLIANILSVIIGTTYSKIKVIALYLVSSIVCEQTDDSLARKVLQQLSQDELKLLIEDPDDAVREAAFNLNSVLTS